MNCRDIEPLLLAERDGVLTPKQHADLATHVAGCPACRHLRSTYGEAITFLKTDAANVTVPDATESWRELEGKLRRGDEKKRPLAPVIWFSAPLAAAAAIAIAYFTTVAPAPRALAPLAAIEAAEPNATTIAYVDKDSGWLVVWATDAEPRTNG